MGDEVAPQLTSALLERDGPFILSVLHSIYLKLEAWLSSTDIRCSHRFLCCALSSLSTDISRSPVYVLQQLCSMLSFLFTLLSLKTHSVISVPWDAPQMTQAMTTPDQVL
jgi:hypothetical protein